MLFTAINSCSTRIPLAIMKLVIRLLKGSTIDRGGDRTSGFESLRSGLVVRSKYDCKYSSRADYVALPGDKGAPAALSCVCNA